MVVKRVVLIISLKVNSVDSIGREGLQSAQSLINSTDQNATFKVRFITRASGGSYGVCFFGADENAKIVNDHDGCSKRGLIILGLAICLRAWRDFS